MFVFDENSSPISVYVYILWNVMSINLLLLGTLSLGYWGVPWRQVLLYFLLDTSRDPQKTGFTVYGWIWKYYQLWENATHKCFLHKRSSEFWLKACVRVHIILKQCMTCAMALMVVRPRFNIQVDILHQKNYSCNAQAQVWWNNNVYCLDMWILNYNYFLNHSPIGPGHDVHTKMYRQGQGWCWSFNKNLVKTGELNSTWAKFYIFHTPFHFTHHEQGRFHWLNCQFSDKNLLKFKIYFLFIECFLYDHLYANWVKFTKKRTISSVLLVVPKLHITQYYESWPSKCAILVFTSITWQDWYLHT